MVAATPASVEEIWEAFKAKPRRTDLRNLLVEHFLYIVKYQAARLFTRLPPGVELDDLISTGTFGLIDAVQAFDLSRAVKFETYCVPRVRGAMLDGLRDVDWVPRLIRTNSAKLATTTDALDRELGRQPTVDEIARRMGLSVGEVETLQQEANVKRVSSIDKIMIEGEHKDFRGVDMLPEDTSEDPTRRLREIDGLQQLTVGMNRSERLLIVLYYYEDQTMKQIGETLDLSESRVSQMHSELIARLRKRMGIAAGQVGGVTIGMKPRKPRLQTSASP